MNLLRSWIQLKMTIQELKSEFHPRPYITTKIVLIMLKQFQIKSMFSKEKLISYKKFTFKTTRKATLQQKFSIIKKENCKRYFKMKTQETIS